MPVVPSSPKPSATPSLGVGGDSAANAYARAARDQAETTVALDATNQLQGLKLGLSNPDTGYRSLLGGDAVRRIDGQALTGHYLSLFDQGWKAISAKLMPGPQAMFDAAALNMRDDFARDLVKHEAEQGRVWRKQVLDTTVSNATGALIAGTDGNDAAAKARAALVADGLGQGLSGEDLDKQTNFAFGRKVVEPVVTARLSQGDVAGAKAFFDVHRDGMAGDDADILDKHLAEAGRAWNAKAAVDGLWQRLGPKSFNDPIDLNAIENDLVVRHGGDEQALMRERDELFHRVLGFTQARDETHAGYTNTVIGHVKDGASPSEVAALPQFLALPKDKQQQLIDWHREQLADKLTGFAPDQNLDRMARQFAAYHDLLSDDGLRHMSDARVQALEPVLGEDLTRQALAKTQAPLDDTDFRAVVSSLGLNADPGPLDVMAKARIGLLRSRIDMAITTAQAGGRSLTPQQRRDIAFAQGHTIVEGHPFFDLPQGAQAVLAVTPEAVRTPTPAVRPDTGKRAVSPRPWVPDALAVSLGFGGARLAPESAYPPLSSAAPTSSAKDVNPTSRLRYDPYWAIKAIKAPPAHSSEYDRNRPSPAYNFKDGPPADPVVDDKGFTLFSTQTIGPSEGFRPGVTVDSGQDVIRLTISNGKRGWVSGKTMDARKSVYDPSEPGSFGNPNKLRDAGVGTAANYFAAGMQDTFGSRIMYQVKRIQENADGTLRRRFFPDKRDIVQQGDLQADFGGKPRTIEIPLTRPKPGEHFHYAVMLSGYDETAPGTSVQIWTKAIGQSEKKKKP